MPRPSTLTTPVMVLHILNRHPRTSITAEIMLCVTLIFCFAQLGYGDNDLLSDANVFDCATSTVFKLWTRQRRTPYCSSGRERVAPEERKYSETVLQNFHSQLPSKLYKSSTHVHNIRSIVPTLLHLVNMFSATNTTNVLDLLRVPIFLPGWHASSPRFRKNCDILWWSQEPLPQLASEKANYHARMSKKTPYSC